MANNKKMLTISICIIMFILLLLLTLVYLILIKPTNEVISLNNEIQYNNIPKEQLGLDTVSRINIIYNYDVYSYDNAKIELSVTGEQANYLITLLKNYEYPDKSNFLSAVTGKYQIILSNGVEFLFDYTDSNDRICACIINGKRILTEMPNELQNFIVGIVNRTLETTKQLYSTDKITIKANNKEILLTDKLAVDEILEQCKFIYDTDVIENSALIFQVIFNENAILEIYENTNSAKLIYNNNQKYVKIPNYLKRYITKIINNYENNLKDTLTTNSITIEQNGKKVEIADTNIINNIITYFNYSDIGFGDGVEYNTLSENIQPQDITIYFDKVQIVILVDPNNGKITGGTSGHIIYPDKTVILMTLREDFIQYMQNLMEKNF